jgi:hypothetical protein
MKLTAVLPIALACVLGMCVSPAYAAHVGGKGNLSSGSLSSIYVDITTPNYPYVYQYSASSAWPMLVNSSTGDKYVQVGWYKANQQGRVADGVHYFSEVNYGYNALTGDYDVHTVWSQVGPQANTIHGYRVRIENGNFVCYADDATIATWPASFTATAYQFYEELNGSQPYNAQFAGQASAHARFANLRIFANNTTTNSPSLTMTKDTNGMYDMSMYTTGNSSSTIDLWDARY